MVTFCISMTELMNGGDRMAKEALDKVREAEEKARELTQEAAQKARDIRRDAEMLADREYKEIMAKGMKESEILKEIAVKEGETLAAPILLSGKKKAEELGSMEAKDLGDAVNIIIERIVKADGNR